MSPFARALARLSEKDRQQAIVDLTVYGQAMIEECNDGTVRLLNPMGVRVGNALDVPLEEKPDG